MGVKGKLIASIEVKCGGHLIHDTLHSNTHHIPNISPSKVNHFQIHGDGKEKFAKEVIESIDPRNKSITWKVIEGDVLDLYDSFKVITTSEHEWTTLIFVYEKKNEDTPESLALFGVWINVIKEIDGHLLKK
ncbi:hypothetical protein H5410_064146 [Solanum commersonii]|uniref:Bet v I/Major latex protein domain-containing protein n=1 Tax=Solanum commersonii TaxID=4109 RepID=A0A9J5W0F9_SOLCO|nr:hypothetical protein H5410_064146 [Solanum commersonii]